MPGIQQIVPLRLGSTPLGKFHPHALATRAGTLFVADLQDTETLTQIPAVGEEMRIPNAAHSVAAKILPAGVSSDQTAASFRISPGTTTAEAVFERTPKGGIHGILNKSGSGIAIGHGARFWLSDTILEYIRVNKTHRFGVSLWARLTRESSSPPTGSSQTQLMNIGYTTNKTSELFSISQDVQMAMLYRGGIYPSPGNYQGHNGNEGSTTAKVYNQSFSSMWHGDTTLVDTVAKMAGGMWWGSVGGAGNANSFSNLMTTHPSWILYGFAIEDLTVSGITTPDFEATVDAETAKVFGTGGRFAGDTFRAPTAVFP